ncbi:HpcH/HpaI aldolase family protein [Sphingobium tyrosinilyticum]|uniref:HpcH/HpaI aldolase/citrate lyase family protein n=1 Tax=Sphingobium tyrosinilyticum TaxID=2715436 RepID=A0ABV9F165_9SPHN
MSIDSQISDINESKPRVGLWISIPDRLSIETVGRAGYDFVILDGQHGGIGSEAIMSAIQTLDLAGVPSFMRVQSNDPAQIMRALDLGACGVIVPLVNNAEQARTAARSCHYPPLGDRSFGPVRSSYVTDGSKEAKALCFVMIETVEAMENLEAIANTLGVAGLFLGPVDLGLSMGLSVAEALRFPEPVMAAVKRIVSVCAQQGLVAGCPAFGLKNGQELHACGITFLPLGADLGLLRRAAAADLAEARAWP